MRLEPRPSSSLAATILWPAGAIVATVVFSSILVMLAGASPLTVFWLVFKGAAG